MNFLKELKKISSDSCFSKNYVIFFDDLLVLLKKEKRPKDDANCFTFIDYNNNNRLFFVPKGVSNTILSDFYMKSYVFPFEQGNIFFKKCDAKLELNKNILYYNIFREYLLIQKFCHYYSGLPYFGVELNRYVSKVMSDNFCDEVNKVINEANFIAKNEPQGFVDLLRLSYDCLEFKKKDNCLLHDFSTVDFVEFFLDKYKTNKDVQFQRLIKMFFVGSEWIPENYIDNCLFLESIDLSNLTKIPLIKKE